MISTPMISSCLQVNFLLRSLLRNCSKNCVGIHEAILAFERFSAFIIHGLGYLLRMRLAFDGISLSFAHLLQRCCLNFHCLLSALEESSTGASFEYLDELKVSEA